MNGNYMSGHQNEERTLTRACETIRIPEGTKVQLAAGATVRITQSLGGDYTVLTQRGELLRISGADADALGLSVEKTEEGSKAEGSLEEQVWKQLRTCYDPEIPANIVDLGLVYGCEIKALPDGTQRIEVTMTLTAQGCDMGQVLKDDIEIKLRKLPGVGQAQVDVVFHPPWHPGMMTEEAKLQLGMY